MAGRSYEGAVGGCGGRARSGPRGGAAQQRGRCGGAAVGRSSSGEGSTGEEAIWRRGKADPTDGEDGGQARGARWGREAPTTTQLRQCGAAMTQQVTDMAAGGELGRGRGQWMGGRWGAQAGEGAADARPAGASIEGDGCGGCGSLKGDGSLNNLLHLWVAASNGSDVWVTRWRCVFTLLPPIYV